MNWPRIILDGLSMSLLFNAVAVCKVMYSAHHGTVSQLLSELSDGSVELSLINFAKDFLSESFCD